MGQLTGPGSAQPYSEMKEEADQIAASRIGTLMDAYLYSLQKYGLLGGDATQTTRQTTAQDASQTQSAAYESATQQENIQNAINRMISEMTGYTSGVTTGTARTVGLGEQAGWSETEIMGDESERRYGEALDRLASERAGVLERFSAAERPLDEAAELYRPGGEYGEGARMRVEEAFRKALAGAQTGLSMTGMHSGSLMEGLRARYESEKAMQMQGIEDVRADRLGQILSTISGIRTASGGALAAMREPSYAGFIGPYGTRTVSGGTQMTSQDTLSQQLTDQISQQYGTQTATADITSRGTTATAGTQTGTQTGSQTGTATTQQTGLNPFLGQILGALS
jgi:hypothetical protein